MRDGKSATQALAALLAADPDAAVRQVAMIGASGPAATHTGERCIAEATHRNGSAPDGSVYSCQANLMRKSTVRPRWRLRSKRSKVRSSSASSPVCAPLKTRVATYALPIRGCPDRARNF